MSVSEVRYFTDDRDGRKRNELVITIGGNGDWYVAVVPEGEGDYRERRKNLHFGRSFTKGAWSCSCNSQCFPRFTNRGRRWNNKS